MDREIKTIKCQYRDYIHVSLTDGEWRMQHGKGELWGSEGGNVDVYSIKERIPPPKHVSNKAKRKIAKKKKAREAERAAKKTE